MPGKHVIFLGAGASHSSGFPLANDLKLLMTSAAHRETKCMQLTQRSFPAEGIAFIDKIGSAIKPFSEASFSSIDEFCRLAQGTNYDQFVPQLKQLMRLVLSMDNPNHHLGSDYGVFVNKLFKEDGYTLRDDLCVLTFNYDCHLDSLLYGAVNWRTRIRTSDSAQDAPINVRDAVTSGYASHGDRSWKDARGFCLLKLHGTLALPTGKPQDVITWNDLHGDTYHGRAVRLSNSSYYVPCIFPWEIIRDGEFIPQKELCLPYQPEGCPADVYTVFRDTWERARREVTKAAKISFVGLSMHPYLSEGLKFLFGDRHYAPDTLLCASPGNQGYEKPRDAQHDPLTPAGRVRRFFTLQNFPHWVISEHNNKPFTGDVSVTARNSFREFIDKDI
jgi:hypothetical protein